MLRPKKNSYKEFDDEKEFLRLENSPPPHNFSNGPSLNAFDFFYLHISCNDNLFFYANARGRSISHNTRLMHIPWGHNTFILQ